MKVSCILPTSGRRAFIPTAVRSFLDQTYADRELVVFDTADEAAIEDLLPNDGRIRYFRKRGTRELAVGDLRNQVCDLAGGELIAHWDDDDWSAPDRLEQQVALIQAAPLDLVGYSSMYFVDCRKGGLVWKYESDRPAAYMLGTSMLYRRAFWHKHPFQRRDVGEDNHFFDDADDPNPPRFATIAGLGKMVARIHGGCTSIKPVFVEHVQLGPTWHPVEDPEIIEFTRGVVGSPITAVT